MKAIRVHKFGGPEVLQLDDVPDPKPGPGQVVVRIRAAGVNPVDTYIRSGSYAMLPTLPYVPGNDCAGVIETVGQRSEEHTSELQSQSNLVCRLLLEKKKQDNKI